MDDQISRKAAIELKPEFLNPNVNRETEEQTAIDRAYARGWNSCNTHWIDEINELPSAQPEPEIYWGYTPTCERPLADAEIVPRLRDIQKQIPGGSYAIDRAVEIIEAVAERRTDERFC